MEGTHPVDHPSRETVKVRQGPGPRATVSVESTQPAMSAPRFGGLL